MASESDARAQIHTSAQRQFRARPEHESDRVRVELLTDPWSVWCWGFEPVRRTLELRFPTIEFEFLLGGMFPRLPAPDEVGFDVDRFFQQVQRTTGMPTNTRVIKEERPESTFPACIHVHAAGLASPDRQDLYLRKLRESVYLDGRNVSDRRVATDVAAVAGIDLGGFDAALDDGSAEKAFEERMRELSKHSLYAYPTILITTKGRTTKLEGFHSLPALLAVVEALTGRIHPPLPDPPLDRIIPYGERVTTREVAEVLGVGIERAYDLLVDAEGQGILVRNRHPKADVWVHPGDAPDAQM